MRIFILFEDQDYEGWSFLGAFASAQAVRREREKIVRKRARESECETRYVRPQFIINDYEVQR